MNTLTIESLEKKYFARHTMKEILTEIPHLSTNGINTDANSHYMHDRETDFLNELAGLDLAMSFLKKCSPRLASEKKYRVNSYSLKHAMENPTGDNFLGSVPNGVGILAARMMGFEVLLPKIGPNADIAIKFMRNPDTGLGVFFLK